MCRVVKGLRGLQPALQINMPTGPQGLGFHPDNRQSFERKLIQDHRADPLLICRWAHMTGNLDRVDQGWRG